MGLKVGEVKLEKWNPKWRENFEIERQNLRDIFGKVALSIQHVGSTSVEGLSAKPIIDIAVGLENLADFELVRERFSQLSVYSIKKENAPGEILIRKGPEEDRAAFIHVMERNGDRMQQTIRFWDILNNDSKTRREYEKSKVDLAKKFPHDRKSYSAAKNDFIQSALGNWTLDFQNTNRYFV